MKKIAVIDDEYIVVAGMTAILERLNLDYKIAGSAGNGVEGCELIRREKPDIVFTDIRMPGLDGLSMIEELKEELPETSFFVISGYTEFEYARRALLLKVENYLDKPITIEKVKACLQDYEDRQKKKSEKKSREMREAGLASEIWERRDDKAINALVMSDSEGFRSCCEEYFAYLSQEISFNRMKEECYRFLCVILEIYAGQKKQYDDNLIIPCTKVMQMEKKEELEEFFRAVTGKIAAETEADQRSCSHRTINRLLQYIHDHYDQDIGLTELADQVDLNPAYLSILFKENVGMSYVKYLTDIRISKAKNLLAQGWKVADVSEKVGYNNYRYFCDIFKKHTGVTPNEYRSSVKNETGDGAYRQI